MFFASEFEIVEHIVLNTNAFYQCFGFMISGALGKRRAGWSFTVLACVNREAFGLDPKLKPGDIDILIVPKKGDRFYASRSVAIEVKVLRLPASNRNKHPRPSGVAQARGMVRDGFPFVGMLHLVVAEPSPKSEWKSAILGRVVGDGDEMEIISRAHPMDWIGAITAERQFGRLRKYTSASCIGAKAISFALNDGGDSIIGWDTAQAELPPTRNPNVRKSLLIQIKRVASWMDQNRRHSLDSRVD